jgi:hypothetical protein
MVAPLPRHARKDDRQRGEYQQRHYLLLWRSRSEICRHRTTLFRGIHLSMRAGDGNGLRCCPGRPSAAIGLGRAKQPEPVSERPDSSLVEQSSGLDWRRPAGTNCPSTRKVSATIRESPHYPVCHRATRHPPSTGCCVDRNQATKFEPWRSGQVPLSRDHPSGQRI